MGTARQKEVRCQRCGKARIVHMERSADNYAKLHPNCHRCAMIKSASLRSRLRVDTLRRKGEERVAKGEFWWKKWTNGYVVGTLPANVKHPLANIALKNGSFFRHWYVMWKAKPDFTLWAKKNRWTIHHRNGIRDDNRLENLQWLAPRRHPTGWSLEDMIEAVRLAGYTIS